MRQRSAGVGRLGRGGDMVRLRGEMRTEDESPFSVLDPLSSILDLRSSSGGFERGGAAAELGKEFGVFFFGGLFVRKMPTPDPAGLLANVLRFDLETPCCPVQGALGDHAIVS